MLEKVIVKMFEMQLKLLTRLLLVGGNALLTTEPKLFITWLRIWNFDDPKLLNVFPTLQVRYEISKFFSHEKILGRQLNDCLEEVDQATNRLFYWGAYADKYGGQVQETTLYGATVCIREPVGVVAIACPDEKPLLSFVSLIAPAIVRSNAVIVIPSEKNPIPGMIQIIEFRLSDFRFDFSTGSGPIN